MTQNDKQVDGTTGDDAREVRQHYERMAATALDWLISDTDRQSDPEIHDALDGAREILADLGVPRPVGQQR